MSQNKTQAIVAILIQLGGIFRILAYLLAVLPFRDFFYDQIAKIRHKFFPKPQTNCPIVPSELQNLFKNN